MKQFGRRGFDIIQNCFFAETKPENEDVDSDDFTCHYFKNFSDFYRFLNGDIYENSCYLYCDFSPYQAFIEENHIDINRLSQQKAFIADSISDISHIIRPTKTEEANRQRIADILAEFVGLQSFQGTETFIKDLSACGPTTEKAYILLFSRYLQENKQNESAIKAFFSFLFSSTHARAKDDDYHAVVGAIIYLFSLYGTEKARQLFQSALSKLSSSRKTKWEKFISALEKAVQKADEKVTSGYDPVTNLFYEKHDFVSKRRLFFFPRFSEYFGSYMYTFTTLEDFVSFRNKDLSGTDLFFYQGKDLESVTYRYDNKTIPPFVYSNRNHFAVHLSKSASVRQGKPEYHVGIKVMFQNQLKCEASEDFDYFPDFCHYLNNDLSKGDYQSLEGLKNLPKKNNIHFENAKLPKGISFLYERQAKKNPKQQPLVINLPPINPETDENEHRSLIRLSSLTKTSSSAQLSWHYQLVAEKEESGKYESVFYLSDLHLGYQVPNHHCTSKASISRLFDHITDNMMHDLYLHSSKPRPLLLIAGDTSSDYPLFSLFVSKLRKNIGDLAKIVFVLGNHELASISDKSPEETLNIYRECIRKNHMILLQEDLLCIDGQNRDHLIPREELLKLSPSELREKTAKAKTIIFGGAAYPGFDIPSESDVNPVEPLSAMSQTPKQDTADGFFKLYQKVISVLGEKNLIILTHTPLEVWCQGSTPAKGVVYVNGHNHLNRYYDNGIIRIFSDNQIGYHAVEVHLKNFALSELYDPFQYYTDGIYSITKGEYLDFMTGKRKTLYYNRPARHLFLLKRNGYYAFFHESQDGTLHLLNGGTFVRTPKKNIQFFYDHMEEVIAFINPPLLKFTAYQKRIAKEVKEIGGLGLIHGTIIDIDFYNHLYLNTEDSKVIPYYAVSKADKVVFPDMRSLLKAYCPRLYSNYARLSNRQNKDQPLLLDTLDYAFPQINPQGEAFPETYIYSLSRKIKEMQNLGSNILTLWPKVLPSEMLPIKEKQGK